MIATTYMTKRKEVILPEEHRTSMGYYRVGLGGDVFRTNGIHNSRPIGLLLGYIPQIDDLQQSEFDPATHEMFVDKDQLPKHELRTDFQDGDHMVVQSYSKPGQRIVLPQTLERVVLVV